MRSRVFFGEQKHKRRTKGIAHHFSGLELRARVLGEPDRGQDALEGLRDVCQRVHLGRGWREGKKKTF